MATAAEDTGKRIYVPASVREFLLRRCPDLPALRVSRRPCTFAFPCLQRQQQSYLLLFPDLRARPGSLCFLRWRVSCSWFFGFSGISLPVSRVISFHYTIDGAAGDNARADRRSRGCPRLRREKFSIYPSDGPHEGRGTSGKRQKIL